MKRKKIYEDEDFLTIKMMYERKGLNLTKIAKALGMSRGNIYKAFHNNYRPTIDKVFNYVSNYG